MVVVSSNSPLMIFIFIKYNRAQIVPIVLFISTRN